jgi:hypothetical protein
MEQVIIVMKIRKIIMFLIIALGFVSVANAQARVPMSMAENIIYSEGYSHVPKDAFHKVFEDFIKEQYAGRNFIYEYEASSCAKSFVYYEMAKGAFKKYPVPKQELKPIEPEPPKLPTFPATHTLTMDLNVFIDQDGGSDVIMNLKKGESIQVLEYGDYADWNGITAKWVNVKTKDGKTGWLFSGYLKEI